MENYIFPSSFYSICKSQGSIILFMYKVWTQIFPTNHLIPFYLIPILEIEIFFSFFSDFPTVFSSWLISQLTNPPKLWSGVTVWLARQSPSWRVQMYLLRKVRSQRLIDGLQLNIEACGLSQTRLRIQLIPTSWRLCSHSRGVASICRLGKARTVTPSMWLLGFLIPVWGVVPT